jgi:hypothetical protein
MSFASTGDRLREKHSTCFAAPAMAAEMSTGFTWSFRRRGPA